MSDCTVCQFIKELNDNKCSLGYPVKNNESLFVNCIGFRVNVKPKNTFPFCDKCGNLLKKHFYEYIDDKSEHCGYYYYECKNCS